MKNRIKTLIAMLLATQLTGCSLGFMMVSDIYDRKKMAREIPKLQQQAAILHQKAQTNQLTASEKLTYAHYIKNHAINTFLETSERTDEQRLQQLYTHYLLAAKDEGNTEALHEYINTLILSSFRRDNMSTPWSLKDMTLVHPDRLAEGLALAKVEAQKSCAIFPLVKRYQYVGYTPVAWTVYPLSNFLQNPAASQYPSIRLDIEQLTAHQQQSCPHTLQIHGSD